VRMAGRFKGDVNVDGDLTIEAGAKIIGSVRADTVTLGGDLEGNIDGASRVELLSTIKIVLSSANMEASTELLVAFNPHETNAAGISSANSLAR